MIKPSDFRFVIMFRGEYIVRQDDWGNGETFLEMSKHMYNAKMFSTMEEVCEFMNDNVHLLEYDYCEIKKIIYVENKK